MGTNISIQNLAKAILLYKTYTVVLLSTYLNTFPVGVVPRRLQREYKLDYKTLKNAIRFLQEHGLLNVIAFPKRRLLMITDEGVAVAEEIVRIIREELKENSLGYKPPVPKSYIDRELQKLGLSLDKVVLVDPKAVDMVCSKYPGITPFIFKIIGVVELKTTWGIIHVYYIPREK